MKGMYVLEAFLWEGNDMFGLTVVTQLKGVNKCMVFKIMLALI
jgi:hypothetical protein